MKKTFLIVCAAAFTSFIVSCNSAPAPATDTSASPQSMPEEKIDYAYQPMDHPPDYWERGDQKYVAMVLKSLKGFENKNIDETMTAFGDSVRFAADGIDKKMSKADLKKFFEEGMAHTASIKISMHDYEAVVSKDKKENWVSLWYKQVTTDMAGKIDSAICMDDLKIENGKVTELDEKQRKYPAVKK